MDKLPGLTQLEVEAARQKYGPNEIRDIARSTALAIFLRQIQKNFIIYLLLAAMILSLVVGKDVTAYTILGVIVAVIFSGFIQEYRAEKAIESLKSMIMPVSIVMRDGRETEVLSRDLVPGDILILGSGERIPADCAVLSGNELRVDESLLTGEAREIKKQPEAEGEDSKLFMGTFIVNGRSIARIEQTGMITRFGKIAALISSAEKSMPLQAKVNTISKYMVAVAIIMASLTALIMIINADALTGPVLTDIFILAIAVAVSAFPEGFPVVLTTTLATGVARMAKNNAIVNRMSIIETLGETTVICADKTGTITKGEMTVNTIYANDQTYEVTGSGYVGIGDIMSSGQKIAASEDKNLSMLFKVAVLCNDTKIQRTGDDMQFKVMGTPTEGALGVLAAKVGMFSENLGFTRAHEIPFNSTRKMMSVLVEEDGSHMVLVKGAPEVVMGKCALESGDRDRILDTNKQMNSRSLRTLALAYKNVSASHPDYSEDGLQFLGLVGMEDPPREEVMAALADCRSAGITVKMITGDNPETAVSIGNQIGLTGKVLEGHHLDELSDEDLTKVVRDVIIFARVRPEHKLRIVRALKQNGEIVTMTGDGVNDAPALKEAHIGVAMGKNGTDVSRSVADLILKDDHFSTIVLAVREGRTIFNNIRKFASYQLSCNCSELYVIFLGVLLAPIFGWETPLLLALHILFMNLVTDNLPAITLGLNSYSRDVMKEPPRRGAKILDKPLVRILLANGFFMGTVTLFIYYLSFNILGQSVEVARTTALVSLIILEIASAFNFRSFRKLTLTRSPFANPFLVYASIISLVATLVVVCLPGAQRVFETEAISLRQWGVAVVAGLSIIVLSDLIKTFNARGAAQTTT